MCSEHSIAFRLKKDVEGYPFEVFSLLQIKKILDFVKKKDVNLIHLFPAKAPWYWKWIIRQLAALKLYVPPAVVDFAQDLQTPDLLIQRYKRAFE
jgi:hypothetical protein